MRNNHLVDPWCSSNPKLGSALRSDDGVINAHAEQLLGCRGPLRMAGDTSRQDLAIQNLA